MSAPSDASLWESLRRIYRQMPKARRWGLLWVMLLMLAGALAEIVTIGAVLPFLALLADPTRLERIPVLPRLLHAVGAETHGQVLLATGIGFCVVAVLAAMVRLQLAWSSQAFVFRLGHDIGLEVQRRVLAQPYSFHISRNTSLLISSLEKVQVLVYNVLLQLMLASSAAVIALLIVAALLFIDPATAAVAAAAFGGIYLVVTLITRGRLRRYSDVITASYAERVQITQESLGGIRDIIIDQSQKVYLDDFEKVDRRFSIAKSHTAFIGAAPRFVIEAAGMILIAVLALVTVREQGSLTAALPVLGALALGSQRLLPLVQTVYYGWSTSASSRGVVADVTELLTLPIEADEPGTAREPLPFGREIRFENVTYVYPAREEPALVGIDFTIPHGARLALIGKTGSGKSTMVDLLMGLIEPTSGRILVDGVALTGAERRAWQRSIAHVPQAIFLADASVARNIAFGSSADRIDAARVRTAARMAQIDEFIETLPEGYETQVGERGVRFSGGQRQRLGIARALYKGAPVLILDEATSALDGETEAAVIRSLSEVGTDRTVVMIAHRLSTISECDLIVRLENGRIVDIETRAAPPPAPGKSAERTSHA